MNAQEILQLYQAGKVAQARQEVEAALHNYPNSEEAWTLKMIVAEHAFERESAMQRVLALNPANKLALQYQQQLNTAAAPMPPQSNAPGALPPLESSTPGAASSSSPLPPLESSTPAAAQPSASSSPAISGDVMHGELPDLGGTPPAKVDDDDDNEPAPTTFEMLWDCEFCGTKKLLAYSHKFCPHCGAAQNPNKRYFPSDDEKVAVKNHVFYGVDVVCANCQTLNSAKADYCVNCGSPLTEGAKAQTLESQVRGAGEKFESTGSRDLVKERFEAEQQRLAGLSGKAVAGVKKPGWSRRTIGIITGVVTLLIACCVGVGALLFWTHESTVTVAGHSWEREIKIEEFQALSQGDWCDSMPGDAYSVSRSERQRSTRQIPDGETCTTRRVDNGDGTYSERQECTTKYRSEPVYDDYCQYTVNRWDYERSVYARGNSLSDAPAWPAFNLTTGSGLGAEREGNREQTYIIHLKDSKSGKTYDCDFNDENRWRQFPIESRWILEIGAIAGDARCDTLKPAS